MSVLKKEHLYAKHVKTGWSNSMPPENLVSVQMNLRAF